MLFVVWIGMWSEPHISWSLTLQGIRLSDRDSDRNARPMVLELFARDQVVRFFGVMRLMLAAAVRSIR